MEKLEAAHTATLRRAEQESRHSYTYLQSLLSERDALAARNLDLQKQLSASQDDLKSAFERRTEGVVQLRAETDQWRAAHQTLQEENTSLRAAYDKDRELWSRFKQWWDGKVQERQSKLGKRSKLSEEDRVVLQGLGLTESLAKAAATVSEAAALSSPLAITSEPARDACDLASEESFKRPEHRITGPSLPIPAMRTSPRRPPAGSADTSQRVQNWLQMVDARSKIPIETERSDAAVKGVDLAKVRYQCTGGEEVRSAQSAGGRSQSKRRRITLPDDLGDKTAPRRRLLISSTSSDMILQRGQTTRSTTPRDPSTTIGDLHSTIKVESDDDTQRVVAKERLADIPNDQHLQIEGREEVIQRRRKEDMEELRRNPWKYRGHGRYADELRRSVCAHLLSE